MEGQTKNRKRAAGPGLLLRWFYRAPVLLYQTGLGGLMFGQLCLTTVGRKSGRRRHTVVDLVKHDAATDTYYVLSAYGAGSNWYRNLRANPTARVQVRWRRFSARTTPVPQEEAEALVVDYWRRHRLYVGTMFRLIGLPAGSEADLRAVAAEMRVLAIQPVDDG